MCVPAAISALTAAVLFTFALFLSYSHGAIDKTLPRLFPFRLLSHRRGNSVAPRTNKTVPPLPPLKNLSSSAGRHYDNVDFAGVPPFIAAAAQDAAAAAKLQSIQVTPGAAQLGGK